MKVKTVILRLDSDPRQIEGIELIAYDFLQINQPDLQGEGRIEIITVKNESPCVKQDDGWWQIKRASIYQRREADERLKRAIGPESPDDDHKNSCLVLIKTMGESSGFTFQNGVELLRGKAFTLDAKFTDQNWLVRISPAGRLNLTLESESGRLRTFIIYWDEGDLDLSMSKDIPSANDWKLA